MGTLNLSLPPSMIPGLPAGLPRKVMRRLIVGNQLGVGSRVLVAGRTRGDLVDFFNRLGLSASAITTSAGAEASPGPVDTSLDESGWDLVLAMGMEAHAGSLLAADALHATANLLAFTRPGGRALLLVRFSSDGCANGGGHTASCFVRHLSGFTGQLEVSGAAEGLAGVDPLAWIVGRRPRVGYLLAGLRIPDDAPSRFGWHEQAEAAIRPEDCCRLKASAVRRSAA